MRMTSCLVRGGGLRNHGGPPRINVAAARTSRGTPGTNCQIYTSDHPDIASLSSLPCTGRTYVDNTLRSPSLRCRLILCCVCRSELPCLSSRASLCSRLSLPPLTPPQTHHSQTVVASRMCPYLDCPRYHFYHTTWYDEGSAAEALALCIRLQSRC